MNRGLIAALAATLAAVWYVAGLGDESDAEPSAADTRRPSSAARAVAAAGEAPGVLIAAAPERAAAEVGRDLFATHSFLPPAPSPAALAAIAARKGPPPAPVAPPLPFRYQGKLMEEGGITVFLAQGERILPARAGDLLNNQYRVESVTATAITFMFEPLKQRQTLTIGSAP
ncbi:hypothetical protein BSY238_439 [Methyloversatilis sp. RAC08]|uniref:hypothetical protein n=1 Tax=Methyloversatilis sp. RAC08 TaxID=1842540 RepID=UPI00083DEED8|nr:hypothetical protein [Methyloversatilis sp. RAC08]AOF82649.1 hypothetical protein BSY238_439 [Methyloversatilis sp. RAC08]